MFLILSGNQAENGKHEGVNRGKMGHNRGSASGRAAHPSRPSVPVDRDSMRLSQSAAAPIR